MTGKSKTRRPFIGEPLERRTLFDLAISGGVHTYATLSDTVTMTGKSELHVTAASNPIPASTIHLNSPDAWFWLDNVKPATVNSTYLSQVRVNGATAVNGSNVRVVQYAMGTVVIPHAPSFQPLQAFAGPNFTGAAQSFSQYTYYDTAAELGTLSRNLSSFKLKRGYMATIATQPNGTGVSKVYVAQDYDLDIALLPSNLDNASQFVRVLPWRWVSKKGASDYSPDTLNAAWHYNWNNNLSSTANWEYVPIQQQPFWPGAPTNQQNVTHWLGFNEPNNPVEDAYQNLNNGSVDAAIDWWPNMLSTGLRVGSPAVTDGGKSWLYEFMDKAIAKGLRVDYIAIHNYQAGHTAATLKAWLQDVYDRYHLPIWLTEFNNGANWTGGADPTYEQNATVIGSFIDMMDNTPWIERYAIYGNVEDVRDVNYPDGTLTPMGVVYRDNASPIGYVQEPPATTNTTGRGIAQLPLDGSTLDTSGHGHNGHAVGAPTYVAGQRGQAIQLDGVNSFVQLPEGVASGDGFTFAAWVNWDGGGNWQRLFDFGDGTNSYLFLTPSNGSNMRFAIKNGGAEQIVQTTPLAIGQWTHVAVTLGGGSAKLYVNGTLAATNNGVTIRPGDFDPALNYIGESQFAADPLFDGRIDDVHVADTALTQAQIAGLMTDNPPQFAAGTMTRGSATRGVPFSGTIAGTATDADAGDTVTYAKANGPAWLNVAADGTLSGTPTFADQAPQEFVVGATDSKGALAYSVLTIPLVEFFWRGDVSDVWTANNAGNTNWSSDAAGLNDPGTVPGANSDVVFAASNAANLPGTILGSNVSVRGIRIQNSAGVTIGGTHNLTLGLLGLDVISGAGAATINTSGQVVLGANQIWNINSALSVVSAISGAAGLTKTGGSTLILSGNNLYTGGTTISNGTLQLGAGGSTGGLLGSIVNNATLLVDRTGTLTLDGLISGSGELIKNGSGTLLLPNNNTFTGGATINNGFVQATASSALGTGALSIGPGGNSTTARLQLSGNITLANAIALPMRNNTTAAVQNVGGNNTLSGVITIDVGGSSAIVQSDAGVLTLGAITSAATGSRILTFTGAGNGVGNGVISNGSGTVGLIKSGAGTWTLSANNTYTGDTTISAGTLALGASNRIADASKLVFNGGGFSTGGFNETVGPFTLAANSTLNFGGGISTLTATSAGTFTAGATMTITNYTPGADHLFIGTTASLTAAQLAQINFNGVAAQQLSSGEVVPVTSTTKTYFWRGDLDGNWSTNLLGNTNWSTDATINVDPGLLPDATTDVIFPASGAANLSTVLGGNFSVRSLTVASTSVVTIGGTHNLTVGVDGVTLAAGAAPATINTSGQIILGANQTWTNIAANTLTVGSVVSGAQSLTKAGAGTVIFTGANTYSGTTTIAAGALQLGNGGSTGGVAGNVVNNGALVFNRTDAATFAGVISGSGSVTKSGAGTITLAATNSYTGGTTIGAAGGASVVRAAANNALGTGSVFIFGNAGSNRLELSGGVTLGNAITQSGRGATVGQTPSILNVSDNNTLSGMITLTTGGTFSTIQSDAGTLTLSGATSLTAGGLTGPRGVLFTGAGNITVAGAINNGGSSAVLQLDKQGAGTVTFGGANTYTGETIASAGKLLLTTSLTTSPALKATGGTIELAAGGNRVVKTSSVVVSGGGRIDLKDNKLIVSGGAVGGVSALVQSAFNGGAWDGSGIATSMPDATAGLTSLAIATAADTGYAGGTFGGVSVDADDVLLMYTYAGDANLDGQVTGDDYSAIDFNILVSGSSGWYNGDFNYDGVITGDDYSAIDFNILAQGAPFPIN